MTDTSDMGEAKDREMSDQGQVPEDIERLKLKYGFWKFILGTFVLGALIAGLSHSIQQQQQDHEVNKTQQQQKHEVLKTELEYLDKYAARVLTGDRQNRHALAQLMHHVSQSEEARGRWKLYMKAVADNIEEAEKAQIEQISLEQDIEELEVQLLTLRTQTKNENDSNLINEIASIEKLIKDKKRKLALASKAVVRLERKAGIVLTEERGPTRAETSDRIDAIIRRIDRAAPTLLRRLAKDPPVPDTKQMTEILNTIDPKQEWKTDLESAKDSLKVRVLYGNHSADTLEAWEAALTGVRREVVRQQFMIGIPVDQVDQVVTSFELQGAKVEKKKQADGTFNVIATFPDE